MKNMEFSDCVIELVGGKDPLCTRTELALQMGVTNQTITDYIGGTQPRWDAVVRLSHYLIREHGYYRLAIQTLLVSAGVSKSNGSVDDEILDIMEASVMLRQGFKSGDKGLFENGLGKLTGAYESLKVEGKTL